jgi:hypothetical protein
MKIHRSRGVLALLAIGMSMAAGVTAAASDLRESTDDLLQQMEEISNRIDSNAEWLSEAGERSRLIAEGQTPEVLPDEELTMAPLPPIEAPPGSDPVRIMTARLTRYVNRNIEITNRYQRELTALSVETLLSPSSYATKDKMERVPERMAMASRAYRRMVRDAREASRAFAAEMRSGDLPAEAIAGFNASFDDGRVIEEQIAMEGKILIHMGTVVAFVLEKRPQTDGDTFLFNKDEDVAEYQRLAEVMSRLIEEQVAMMRAQQAKIAQSTELIQKNQ